jgi:hypothetical protein
VTLNYAERLLLLQALIIRRVPSTSRITPVLLLEALQGDIELVREKRPDLYFQHFSKNLSQEVQACVEVGYLEDGSERRPGRWSKNFRPGPVSYKRTEEGDRLLNSLGVRLGNSLDEMPMSDVGLLDFLSLL